MEQSALRTWVWHSCDNDIWHTGKSNICKENYKNKHRYKFSGKSDVHKYCEINTKTQRYNPPDGAHARSSGDPWQRRHNERDSVSKHQPRDLLNSLFRCRSKKTSKLCVTGLCEENSPVTGEFPTRRASNTWNVSIWWRHHDQSEIRRIVVRCPAHESIHVIWVYIVWIVVYKS